MKTYSNSLIKKFLKKYYLDGLVETALLEIKNGNLLTIFKNFDERNEKTTIRGRIQLTDIGLPDNRLGIYSTANFIKCLDNLNENITVEYKEKFKSKEFPQLLLLKDNVGTEVKIHLTIRDLLYYDGKMMICPFAVIVPLNKEILNRILQAVKTTSSHEIVFREEAGKLKVIAGFDSFRCSAVKIDLPVLGNCKINNHIFLDTSLFTVILKNNINQFDTAYLKITDKGGLEIEFIDKDLTAIYWISCASKFLHITDFDF